MFIVSFALFLAAILLFAGFLLPVLATPQQQTTTTSPLLPSPPASSSSGTPTGQATSPSSIQPLTLQEQEQLNRLQNVIAATNLNLDETEKQIGGIVYTPRWSDPVWVEPDSAAVLVAYCLPGEFAESGQEILGGSGFELEVLESYEVALPQNFTAWMMVIGNEDRQNRYPAAVGVICASDANDSQTRVLSPDEEQQINNVIQQITQVTSIDQVINIINRNNNATNQNATGGAGGGGGTSAPPPTSRDTTPPTLTVPNDMVLQTSGGAPTALLVYSVTAQDDRDGTATLDEDNQLIQGDSVGGNIFISCSPSSQYFLPVGNRTVECIAADAVNNTADASFTVTVTNTPPTGAPSGSSSTVTASANPAIYNGVPCPSPLEFTGTVTDNVGNRDVTYRFIFSTGARTPGQVIHFDQPGSQRVSYPSPGIVPPSLEGWVAIEILEPVQLQSNQAEMRIICSSGGGITASLSVNPPFYEGPCPPPDRPTVLQWIATVTDNVGNRDVKYRYVYSTGGTSGEGVIHFDQPGSQSVTIYTTPVLGKGWGFIEILEPVQLQSNRVDFEVICTPGMGGAQAPQTLQAENATTATTDDEEEDATAPPPITDDEEDTTTDGEGDDTGGGGTDADDTDSGDQLPPPAGTTTDGEGDDTGGGGTGGSTDDDAEPQ